TALALGLSVPAFARQDQASVLDQKVSKLFDSGKYIAALPLARQALAMREKATDEAKLGNSLNNLAALEYNLGHYAVAEPLYKRALAIAEKLAGPDDEGVARLLHNTRDIYRVKERLRY